MAKGNPLLGFARGSIGDVTFWRQDGEQHTRARNRNPKNPQTPLQLLQRVCLKTASQAYSLMQQICDHSFQGLQEGTKNQSRFIMANVADMRARLASEINSGDAAIITTSTKTNFATKDTSLPVINEYIVSEGTLSPLAVELNPSGKCMLNFLTAFSGSIPTYAELVNLLGVQRGDQLTVISLLTDDTEAVPGTLGFFNGFYFGRVILDPAGGDMTVPFADNNGNINDPNPKNDGDVGISWVAESTSKVGVVFGLRVGSDIAGKTNTRIGGTIILSRLAGTVWQRSTQRLVLQEPMMGGVKEYDVWPLGDAVLSFLTADNSSLYLNQADSF